MCGLDRVVFGSDFGAVPYGVKEHVQIVEDVLRGRAERDLVFWQTSDKVFRLGLGEGLAFDKESSREFIAVGAGAK